MVLFALLVGVLGHDRPSLEQAGGLLLREGVGGLAFGLVLGYAGYYGRLDRPALSLPAGSWRDIVVSLTYAVVMFSILAQGGPMRSLLSRLSRRTGASRNPT